MDDLGTNAERMDRRYLWRAGKCGHRVHIENPETERAYCQVENCGGKPFDGKGAEIPTGRRLCGNCTDLAGRSEADYREPDIRVLLGERLAEVEPELFAGTVAPEPWKRGKQVRRFNRPKGRKPKHSTAKYLRPFDDDLPSWWGTPGTAGMSARIPWRHRGKGYISILATAAE